MRADDVIVERLHDEIDLHLDRRQRITPGQHFVEGRWVARLADGVVARLMILAAGLPDGFRSRAQFRHGIWMAQMNAEYETRPCAEQFAAPGCGRHAKMNVERVGCLLIGIGEEDLLHELRLLRRQFRKGVKVTLETGGARANGLCDQLAAPSRVFNDLAVRPGPLFQVEGGYEVMV